MSFNATLTWPDPRIVSVISSSITFVLGGAGGRYVLVKVGSRSTNCSEVTAGIIGSSIREGSTGKTISDGGFVVVGLELVELVLVNGFCGCKIMMVGVT